VNAAVILRDVKDGRTDWCSTATSHWRKSATDSRAQFERGKVCKYLARRQIGRKTKEADVFWTCAGDTGATSPVPEH